jgi:glutamine synthetase
MCEYVWIGGCKGDLRSKTKVLATEPKSIADCPEWNYDGSSTNQAPGDDSEVILKPVAMYPDPFRGGNNKLVLCETFTPEGEPLPTNARAVARGFFDQCPGDEPWYGIEQEYTMFRDGTPLGWPRTGARSFGGPTVQIGYPGPQGPYYCSAGADVAFGRDLAECHLKACLYAGLTISGINAEVMAGQWEYQVGPCLGISSGDEVTMSRYILHRCAEMYDVVISIDPKPIPGDWNGSGCHTNFSTKAMREDGGLKAIYAAIGRMAERHDVHIAAYGEGNEKRMTGEHETSDIKKFSWGIANRGASVRVGNQTFKDGKGYLEDRRPASNMDPYVVTGTICETICVGRKDADDAKYISLAEQTEKKSMSRSSSLAAMP